MDIRWLGIQTRANRSEQLISALGGTVNIALVSLISYILLGLQGTLAIVPSIGAATVLLFAVPHGPLSQPWALFAGNLISAFIGVSVALVVPNMIVAAALAVGLAIGAMLMCRCTHPPGGATALAAVIGGTSIHDLGYGYLLVPVLLNCSVTFLVAVGFNNLFGWRRYPATAMRYKPIAIPSRTHIPPEIQHLEEALTEIGLVDVTPTQLRQIYKVAEQRRIQDVLSHFDFELGAVYTNNRPGAEWSVRRIIDYAQHPDPEKELVIYKVLEGAQKRLTGSCTRAEFADWAAQRLSPVKT